MKITNKDIITSYLAQFLQIGSSIIVLPLILKKLDSNELGIWYIFLSISTLVYLLDFGFAPTIQRNVTYIYSGVKKLSKEGVHLIEKEDKIQIDYNLLQNIIEASKKIYFKISLLAFTILITLGNLYIYSLIKNLIVDKKIIFLSWQIFILSNSLNLYYGYYTPLLVGAGKITKSNITLILSKLVYLFLCYILLNLKYGLVGIAVANILSAFINRQTSKIYFYDKHLKNEFKKLEFKEEKNIFEILWFNSKKMGIISLAAYCIYNANIIIVSKYFSLEIVGQFGFTLQILNLLKNLSGTIFFTKLPLFNMYRAQNKMKKLKNEFFKSLKVSLSLFLIGSLLLLFAGDLVLQLLSIKTLLMPKLFICLFIINYILDINCNIFSNLISTDNRIPTVKAALISGILIILTTIILLEIDINIYILAIVPIIIQSFYNYWKWPVEGMKILRKEENKK